MPDLGARMRDGRVLVMDGAMGTMLYESGVFVNVCYDELNATRPDLVAEVHRQYIHAGAQIVGTNTFGANPAKLAAYRLDDRTEELNRRAAEVALRAVRDHGGAGERVDVVGVVGPLGVRLEPLGPTSLEEARAYYARQVDGLLAGGVAGFVLETFSNLAELEQAYLAVRSRSELPVVAQVTVGEDGATSFGVKAEEAARAATAWGADAVGLNCSVGPAVALDAIGRMAQATSRPLSALPNAGLPRAIGDRKIYLARPQYMARYARRLVAAGARIVGGCCGTTPEHVRRIAEQIADMQPQAVAVAASIGGPGLDPVSAAAPPLEARSELGRRLAAGDFVTSVRVVPPRGCDPSALVRDCRILADAGAVVVLVDEDRRSTRMSPAAAAAAVLRASATPEPAVRYSCRDRRLPEMVGDLLGLAALGLRNVVLRTGDPPSPGPYPHYQSSIDVDAIGLANAAAKLNAGMDPMGGELGSSAGLVVGVAMNHTAGKRDRELRRASWKAKAGADFAVTAPVFDVEPLEAFLADVEPRTPVLAGVLVLESVRQAEFLRNEVPGVRIPGRIVERMRRAEAVRPGRALSEGVDIACETVEAVRGRVAGVHVHGARDGLDAPMRVLTRIGS